MRSHWTIDRGMALQCGSRPSVYLFYSWFFYILYIKTQTEPWRLNGIWWFCREVLTPDLRGLCQTSMDSPSFRSLLVVWRAEMSFFIVAKDSSDSHTNSLPAVLFFFFFWRSHFHKDMYEYSLHFHKAASTSPALILTHSYPTELLQRQKQQNTY